MIITVTLNPALDKTLVLSELQTGKVNRVKAIRRDAGGRVGQRGHQGRTVLASTLRHVRPAAALSAHLGGDVREQLAGLDPP